MTRPAQSPIEQLADIVRDLTEPMTHFEDLDAVGMSARGEVRYRSSHVSLLEQLDECVSPGSACDDAGLPAPRVWESSLPVCESALDAKLRIDVSVARWLSEWCGGALREGTAGNLRALVGAMTCLEPYLQRALVRDAKAWRVWCRVEAGWDRRTMSPSEPCPCCMTRHSLRVRGDGVAAWCVTCGEAWAEDDPDMQSVLCLAAALAAARKASLPLEGLSIVEVEA